MQSGQAASRKWILEFEPSAGVGPEPLMGWTAGADTSRQVRLYFDTRDEAIAFARSRGLPHQVLEPRERAPVLKSYSDNFSYRRKEPWSH